MRESDSDNEGLINYTFFSEIEGSTLIEQFTGKDLGEAMAVWYRESKIKPEEPMDGDEPAPVQTVKNVWCTSGYDLKGKFYLTHIIATI
jgi:hypothetical protein